MPRINRRKRSLGNRGLSGRQWEVLVFGSAQYGPEGEGFTSLAAERDAWRLHRDQIMAGESTPGRRPYAFFRHELRTEPRRWFHMVHVLMRHQLVDAVEAATIEVLYGVLGGDQGETYCGSFENPEFVSRTGTEDLQQLFEIAAEWHTWRCRPELAEAYRRRAALIQQAGKADRK